MMHNNDRIKIRNLIDADFPALDKHFGEKTKYRNKMSKWEQYLSEQNEKKRIAKVILINNQLIGIGSLKFHSDNPFFADDNVPEIHDVLIAIEYQNHGYGRRLISELEIEARNLEFKTIGLGVGLYQDYGLAQILYVKMGYVPDGRGVTYANKPVIPGELYKVDDDLLLWLLKSLEENSV